MTTGDTGAIALSFTDIADATFPPRDPVLIHTATGTPMFCTGHLGQVAAQRGVGKTLFMRTLALVMASGGSALGYHCPRPRRVLYLDGEMSKEDIKDRDRVLEKVVTMPNAPELFTIAADWQVDPLPLIDTEAGQAFIADFMEWAEVVIVDNRSCLFDSAGEKDVEAWEPARVWLMHQRRLKKAVMMVHHSGRNGMARGLSRPEDPLNLTIALSHPRDYAEEQGARFEVNFTKHRNISGGAAVRSYVTQLTDTGWVVEDGLTVPERSILTEVDRAWKAGQPFKVKTKAVDAATGNRADLMEAWDTLVDRGRIAKVGGPGGFAFMVKVA